MIKIKKPKTDKAITTDMTLAGETFEIDLMPLTEEERLNIFKTFRKRRNILNPISKQMEVISYFDDDDPKFQKAADDLLDKVIVDFRGLGEEENPDNPTGKLIPLDGTLRENKLLIGSVKVKEIEEIPIVDENGQTANIKQPRERYFRTLILDKAVELSQATAEAETKNL